MNIRATSNFRPGNAAAILETITKRVLTAVTEGTEYVEATAQFLAPERDGTLRDSIGHSVELAGLKVNGYVFAAAPHAAFVEFGTGLVGAASDHGTLPTEGVPFTGSWVYDFRGQGWKGMPAQPYLRPAIDAAEPEVLDAFRRQGFRM